VLGVSSSVVSRRLVELRAWSGDPLFVRVGHEMVPTPRAMAIGETLDERLEALSRLVVAPPVAAPVPPQRRYVVACADAFLTTLLPPVVERLAREAPRAVLEVVQVESATPSIVAALVSGGVDFYLGPPLGRSEGLFRRRILDADFTCAIARTHPRVGDVLDLDTFCDLAHVLVAARFPARSLVDDALAELGRERRVVLTTPYFLGALSLVAQTDLVVTLPRRPATMVGPALGVRLLAPPFPLPRVPLYVQWHERWNGDAGHAWLRDRFERLDAALPDDGASRADADA